MIIGKNFPLIILQIFKENIIFAVFFASILLLIRSRIGKKNNVGCFFLYLYTGLIFGVTVLGRITDERVITEDYLGICQLFSNPWYLVSFVENILMFVLFGSLYVLAWKEEGHKSSCIRWAVFISVSIEFLQGIFQLGEAQFIDICANVFGAWIGYMLASGWRKYRRKQKSNS